MFFKRLVDLKNEKVKFDTFPKTHEEYISVTYGCIRFIASYRFLSESLDELVKKLDVNDFKIFLREFPDKWQNLNEKLAYPYQSFNIIDDSRKPNNNWKKDFFSKLKNKCPEDVEIARTKEMIDLFVNKNGEKVTKLFCKSDVILLADVLRNLLEYLLNNMD